MENSYTRLSKSQSFSRHASNNDIKSSLRDIKNDYTKALEQIEDLKSERSYLKAALNRSTEEKHNKSVRDESISVGQVSQTLKNSYASKALVDSEKRVLDLEEENKQLKKLVKSHGKKFLKMQEEILSYQYQADKLDYLKVYNKDLQAEMELLDQEFQAIIKRVDGIDEEKSQSQINQSISVKQTKEFKQVLLKYSNYITRAVSALDPKNSFRFRFEDTFSSASDLLNLVANKDYSTLILKAMKLIIDLLPNNPDFEQEESVRNSPFSVGETTPQKVSVFNNLNDQIFSQLHELSPHSSILLPTSLTRGMQNSVREAQNSAQIRSQIKSPLGASQAGQQVNESHKKPRETHSSLSFGTRESKPQSMDMKVETPRSMRSQQEIVQKLEVSPTERPTHNFPEIRINTSNSGGSPYIREEFDHRTAAELELIQREKDLIQRERELMDKKKEYLMRSRELNDRDQSMSEQRSIRENMRSPNENSVEHGRIKSQRRIQTFDMDDSTLRIREEEEFEQQSLQRREDEFEQHRRSPMQLKSILKSSSSQMIDNLDQGKDSIIQRRKEDETLSIGSAGQVRSAKDISNVLREKSRHIAKVLTKGSLYEDDLQSVVSKSEHDISINRSRDRSPVNSYKVFEEEGAESLKANKMKSSDKILHEDFESRFGSNDTSLVADKKSWFYPKSIQNQSLNKSPLGEPRKESNESKKDESSNKKVSFYAQYQKSTGSDNQDSVTSHNQSQSQRTGNTTDYDRQQSVAFGNSRRFNEAPRGTQYASFSVAFGRTESAERDPASPLKNLGSIIDVYMKKRVEHVYQTYDVVKGEEAYKKAVRDNGSPQYKVVADGSMSNRRAKKCFFNSDDFLSSAGKASN